MPMSCWRLRDAVSRPRLICRRSKRMRSLPKVASYGSQSLVDGNREMYDWLRNGVPLDIESGGTKGTARAGDRLRWPQ